MNQEQRRKMILKKEFINKVKKQFYNLTNKSEFYIVTGVFFFIVTLFYIIFFTPNYYVQDSPVKFEIKNGEPLNNIINNLYDKGIIPSKKNMLMATYFYGAQQKLRAARYFIPNGLSYLDLIDLFTKGKADFLRKVTIRDGLTTKWMAYIIKNKVFMDSTLFVNLNSNKRFIKNLGLRESSLQGYLLPGTYYFYERSTPQEIIAKLYSSLNNFIDDNLYEEIKKSGLTLHEVLTLASIIKGETNNVNEMPKIASVYLNRLRIGMKLQADPTIQYIQKNGWKKLYYKDLKQDSPYNTYLYAGLPPGPINNPGKAAILSVLNPVKTRYLYFVANGNGSHNFAKTFNQHLRNIKIYKRWLRIQKRKSKQKS